MQPTLEQLAKELIECRGKLQELEERQKTEREPYEQAKAVIQEKLLACMAKANTLSTRFEDFTISRKKSTKAVITNDGLALDALKTYHPEYVILSISPLALKEVEKGSLAVDGVTVETREYISIRAAKE
jgi:hypothetical protein